MLLRLLAFLSVTNFFDLFKLFEEIFFEILNNCNRFYYLLYQLLCYYFYSFLLAIKKYSVLIPIVGHIKRISCSDDNGINWMICNT